MKKRILIRAAENHACYNVWLYDEHGKYLPYIFKRDENSGDAFELKDPTFQISYWEWEYLRQNINDEMIRLKGVGGRLKAIRYHLAEAWRLIKNGKVEFK